MFLPIQWWCTGWKGQRSTAYSGGLNDQRIPLQSPSSERSDQEWQVFTPLCWHSVCLTNTFLLFSPSTPPSTSPLFLLPSCSASNSASALLSVSFVFCVGSLGSAARCERGCTLRIFRIKHAAAHAHKYTPGSGHCEHYWHTFGTHVCSPYKPHISSLTS